MRSHQKTGNLPPLPLYYDESNLLFFFWLIDSIHYSDCYSIYPIKWFQCIRINEFSLQATD